MNGFQFRHRHALALTFVVLAVVTLAGGLLNSVDMHGRLVDDLSDKGVAGGIITHGIRTTTSDQSGEFSLTGLPRTSKVQIDRNGYMRTSAPPTAEEIRLVPFSLTIYAYDATKTPDDRVKDPQARQDTKVLATGGETGQIIIAPYPGKDAKILICAAGFEPKEIKAEGVLMQVGLEPGGTGCPPLPTPSPAPDATPSPEPSPEPPPSPEPSPQESPSPSPTGAP